MWCEKCGKKQATEIHHRFSQTKANKSLYGKLIHHPKNLQKICYNCHHTKALDKWSEKEFCQALGIEPKSKSSVMRAMRVSQK